MSKRDLANMDSDMFTPIGRLLQQAMAHGITNDMVYGGLEVGQTALQALHALPVATQNCRIGTRRVTWDGRVYKYGSASGTLNPGFLSYSLNTTQEMAYASVQADVAAGATELAFTVGGSDGDGSGNIAVDKLKDGYLHIFYASDNEAISMRIESNTLVESGGTMTLTLEEGLPIAITTSMAGEAMATPYADIRGNGDVGASNVNSFIGMPTIAATAVLPYHWQQTWGIRGIVPANGYGSANIGNADYATQVVAYPAGSGMIHDYNATQSPLAQHIGFVVSRAQNNTQGLPFIMLQISP